MPPVLQRRKGKRATPSACDCPMQAQCCQKTLQEHRLPSGHQQGPQEKVPLRPPGDKQTELRSQPLSSPEKSLFVLLGHTWCHSFMVLHHLLWLRSFSAAGVCSTFPAEQVMLLHSCHQCLHRKTLLYCLILCYRTLALLVDILDFVD